MGDENLSKEISNYLTENLPQLLIANKSLINKMIADNLDKINKILAGNKILSDNDKFRFTSYIINCGGYEL